MMKRQRTARLRPGAGAFFLVAGWLASASAAGPAHAQARPFRTDGEGVIAGRFIVFPSLSVDLLRDSNVLYASDDLSTSVDSGSDEISVRPRILVDLPIGRGRVRWVYSPVYRNYTNDSFHLPRRFSHYFDLQGDFQIGPTLRMRISDHFVRGVVELQEIDHGGEFAFGLTSYTSHEPSMQIDLDIGARQGFSLLPRYTRVQFSEGPETALQSYSRSQLEGRYNLRVGPTDVLYGFYTREESDQRRGSQIFPDLRLTGQSAGLGLSRTLNQEISTTISAGYKTITFEGGDARGYSGLVVDLNAALQLSETTSLALIAGRQPYQSFFLDNSYYMDDQVGVKILQQVGRSLYWEIGGSVRSNTYGGIVDFSVRPGTPLSDDCNGDGTPDSSDCDGNGRIDDLESAYCLGAPGGGLDCPSLGTRRKDRVLHYEIGAGYKVLRTLRVFIGYNADRRRSNIEQVGGGAFFDPYDYTVKRLIFRIEAGWL